MCLPDNAWSDTSPFGQEQSHTCVRTSDNESVHLPVLEVTRDEQTVEGSMC